MRRQAEGKVKASEEGDIGGRKSGDGNDRLTRTCRQHMCLRLHAALRINLGPIHALQDLLQIFVVAEPVRVEESGNLSAVKLGVAEHGLLGGEGAEHAIVAEESDPVGVVSHAGEEAVDGGFGLVR